ncbi:DUF6968 family protein [Bradyrhizobium sp. SRS-191]|uniref:DUF6968 family protein n=1 Tax=Bradyrhizobium sp. SRS-191 TaxID=2962606 RepID=UPI00211F29CE|nr:hypothetical protein [Bradyrhizobium sp. SRS-191]
MTTLVAERSYRKVATNSDVVARLFAPERVNDCEWRCRIELHGLTSPVDRSIIGGDSFQALYLGLQLLCRLLADDEAELASLDGASGDADIPLVTSCCFPQTRTEALRFVTQRDQELLDALPGPVSSVPPESVPGTPMTDIVAERVLRDVTTDAAVVARLSAPKRAAATRWSCEFEVRGLGRPMAQAISGADSFQALYLGLRAICVHLEQHEHRLALPFDGAPSGDAGLPFISFCPPQAKQEAHRYLRDKLMA